MGKIHDVDKSTLLFGFQLLFCVRFWSLAQKTKQKMLGQNCFTNVVSDFLKQILNVP